MTKYPLKIIIRIKIPKTFRIICFYRLTCKSNITNINLKVSNETIVDAKTKLQEFSLKKYKSLPVYKIISNTGPRHKPVFKVGVKIKNTKFTYSNGSSKKNAEQSAASMLLENLNLK